MIAADRGGVRIIQGVSNSERGGRWMRVLTSKKWRIEKIHAGGFEVEQGKEGGAACAGREIKDGSRGGRTGRRC